MDEDVRHAEWILYRRDMTAVVFAVGHPKPPGPIGMTLFLGGILWLELRPREQPAPEVAAPVPN
jgi:hypothetical protein